MRNSARLRRASDAAASFRQRMRDRVSTSADISTLGVPVSPRADHRDVAPPNDKVTTDQCCQRLPQKSQVRARVFLRSNLEAASRLLHRHETSNIEVWMVGELAKGSLMDKPTRILHGKTRRAVKTIVRIRRVSSKMDQEKAFVVRNRVFVSPIRIEWIEPASLAADP